MPYSPFRHIGSAFFGSSLLHLTFFVTRKCNSRCPFCFYLSEGRQGTGPELTLEEIEKVSSSAGTLLWLAFSGGEVFLRDDIVEITEVFYRQNRPAIILFPTNGLLPDIIRAKTEEILRRCGKSTIVVKLSLDGPEDLHDSMRGVRGSFQKTMQTYDLLKELSVRYPNFELGVNTVFTGANQDSMDSLIEFVSGLDGVRTHTVSLVRGAVADRELKKIDNDKYSTVIEKLAANLRKKEAPTYGFRGAKLKAAQDILQRSLIRETLKVKKQVIPCYAGRHNLVLTETGDVFPCESFSMKMGNVREDGYDLKAIQKRSGAREVLHAIKNRKCFCTHECYFMTNILFNPRMYPALLREYLRI